MSGNLSFTLMPSLQLIEKDVNVKSMEELRGIREIIF
jgi:hypothetical protein